MKLSKRIRTNLEDVVEFGPGFLWRHSPRITKVHTAEVKMRNRGTIHLRAGESDVAAVREVFGKGQYNIQAFPSVSSRIMSHYSEIINRGRVPIIIDAGANIGAASLWFASQYKEAGIVAIEPEYENFRVLRKNSEFNGRIRALHAAIGSSAGFVSVHSTGLGWASQTTRSDSGIQMITIEDAAASISMGELFIVKIDIEGFEKDLFSANTEWLDQAFVVFVEPHDWMLPGQGTSRTFQQELGKRNFEVFIMGEILTYVRLPA